MKLLEFEGTDEETDTYCTAFHTKVSVTYTLAVGQGLSYQVPGLINLHAVDQKNACRWSRIADFQFS